MMALPAPASNASRMAQRSDSRTSGNGGRAAVCRGSDDRAAAPLVMEFMIIPVIVRLSPSSFEHRDRGITAGPVSDRPAGDASRDVRVKDE
jgi:hypothetical protein